MHYAVDGHGLIDEFVEHRIRKPADESPPKLTLDTCVEFRRATNPLQTRDNAVEELAPESGPLFLIPPEAGRLRRRQLLGRSEPQPPRCSSRSRAVI